MVGVKNEGAFLYTPVWRSYIEKCRGYIIVTVCVCMPFIHPQHPRLQKWPSLRHLGTLGDFRWTVDTGHPSSWPNCVLNWRWQTFPLKYPMDMSIEVCIDELLSTKFNEYPERPPISIHQKVPNWRTFSAARDVSISPYVRHIYVYCIITHTYTSQRLFKCQTVVYWRGRQWRISCCSRFPKRFSAEHGEMYVREIGSWKSPSTCKPAERVEHYPVNRAIPTSPVR